MTEMRRLVPDIPFPPYSFVPGQTPHPVSDPAGHSHGRTAEKVTPLDPDDWRRCPTYLFAIDLFNHGYYWEAHEAWEALWHAAGRTGLVADFLKALIKLAAAGVKHREGRPGGVRSHARRACELLRAVASEREQLAGLRPDTVRELAVQIERDGWPVTAPVLVAG